MQLAAKKRAGVGRAFLLEAGVGQKKQSRPTPAGVLEADVGRVFFYFSGRDKWTTIVSITINT